MGDTVLVFEGQGATSVPGEPAVDLRELAPAEAQRAIVLHQLGRARACLGDGSRLAGVLGQSLGEVTALVVAGALSEEDGLRFVGLRASLPGELLPDRAWTMASMTRLRLAKATSAAEGLDLWIVGRNGPADCIVVGVSGDFATFVDRVGATPTTYRELPVVAPYHTPAMAPVASALGAVVADMDVRDPSLPVFTPTGPGEVRTAEEARRALVDALTAPVAWSETLVLAAQRWPDARWRECGPSCSLHRFVWKNGLSLDWGEA